LGTEKISLKSFRVLGFSMLTLSLWFGGISPRSQSSGNMEGVVKDRSGAAVLRAIVVIENPVSQYEQTANTDANGNLREAVGSPPTVRQAAAPMRLALAQCGLTFQPKARKMTTRIRRAALRAICFMATVIAGPPG
jgi:hypothetical protein